MVGCKGFQVVIIWMGLDILQVRMSKHAGILSIRRLGRTHGCFDTFLARSLSLFKGLMSASAVLSAAGAVKQKVTVGAWAVLPWKGH